ncbi:MAG: MBL fold metallo-hydrolase [Hyphomicrobiaceae bacterium]|nr:MBL fold metallo-hydrolase [Hyphomicrobiaceae bacterium]
MRLTVVGCGDAFGSGGRLQTCYHVDSGSSRILLDCGATALIGLNRLGIDPNGVDAIVISHLHGDHFAGLVWWLLHAQHVAKRTGPMTIAGPPGIEARFTAACEALFPGSSKVERRFALSFQEMRAGAPADIAGSMVAAYEVSHPSGAPSHALRLTAGGRTLAFSGDTEWVEPLVECGRAADLFIMECYALDGPIRYHMSWETISKQLPRIGARKVMLTHMNDRMLANRDRAIGPGIVHAADGLVLDV